MKVFRAEWGLTQEQLAGMVGVTRQTIIAVEQNKYVPSLLLAFKIARAFGAEVEEVFQFENKESNEK